MLFRLIRICLPVIVPLTYVSVLDRMWDQYSALCCNPELPCKRHFSTSSVDQNIMIPTFIVEQKLSHTINKADKPSGTILLECTSNHESC
jgi:hypothetical protein